MTRLSALPEKIDAAKLGLRFFSELPHRSKNKHKGCDHKRKHVIKSNGNVNMKEIIVFQHTPSPKDKGANNCKYRFIITNDFLTARIFHT